MMKSIAELETTIAEQAVMLRELVFANNELRNRLDLTETAVEAAREYVRINREIDSLSDNDPDYIEKHDELWFMAISAWDMLQNTLAACDEKGAQ